MWKNDCLKLFGASKHRQVVMKIAKESFFPTSHSRIVLNLPTLEGFQDLTAYQMSCLVFDFKI